MAQIHKHRLVGVDGVRTARWKYVRGSVSCATCGETLAGDGTVLSPGELHTRALVVCHNLGKTPHRDVFCQRCGREWECRTAERAEGVFDARIGSHPDA